MDVEGQRPELGAGPLLIWPSVHLSSLSTHSPLCFTGHPSDLDNFKHCSTLSLCQEHLPFAHRLMGL